MRYTKRLFAAGAAMLAAALVLTSCSSGDSGSDAGTGDAGTNSEQIIVGYSGAVQADPNNKSVEDGMRVKVEELGGKFLVTDANLDASKQLADVRSLIAQGIDVLVIWPMDTQGIQPAIKEATDAGVEVIVQDTAEGGPYASNFQMTNFEAAEDAARLIAETVGKGAGVVSIQGIPAVGVLDARNKGFAAGAEEHGLNVLAEQINDTNNADGARPIIDAWKSRFGAEIEAVFAYNDLSALGAASANTDDFSPVVIGMNGEAEAVDAVADGRLLATYNMHPVEMGAALGWGAMELAGGRTLPATVVYELTLLTADNLDTWHSPAEMLQKKIAVEIVEENGVAKLKTTVS